MTIAEPTKAAFLKTWPGGYGENWEVYGKATGISEEALVNACLVPFYNQDHIALEIGCGIGFWVNKYLVPNFREVIALDLLPDPGFKSKKVHYIEVPDRNYECFGVSDNSVDFVWSFGLFCHLPLECVEKYLRNVLRVLKPKGRAALYFSNTERRPVPEPKAGSEDKVSWVANDWETTEAMLYLAGFVAIRDLLPTHKDTMAYAEKP